jgi:hypothetical protein
MGELARSQGQGSQLRCLGRRGLHAGRQLGSGILVPWIAVAGGPQEPRVTIALP